MSNVLSFELEKTAIWRERTAERYPQDWRNAKAVEALRSLSAAKLDNAELTRKYESLCEDADSDRSNDVHTEVLGAIGFGFAPKNVEEVLEYIVDQLVPDAANEAEPPTLPHQGLAAALSESAKREPSKGFTDTFRRSLCEGERAAKETSEAQRKYTRKGKV